LKDDNSENGCAIQPEKGLCRCTVAAVYDIPCNVIAFHSEQSCCFQSFTGGADIWVVLMAVRSYFLFTGKLTMPK